jgi:replicative DNA helicase
MSSSYRNHDAERRLLAQLIWHVQKDTAAARQAIEVVGAVGAAALTIDCGAAVWHGLVEAAKRPSATILDIRAAMPAIPGPREDDADPGLRLLAELIEDQLAGYGVALIEHTIQAAREVVEAFELRQAALAAEMTLAAIEAGRHRGQELETLRQQIERVQAARTDAASAARPAASGMAAVLDAWARNEKEPVVVTGFRPIDGRLGGGLPVGGIVAIGAKPGTGKSALAGQLALGALIADRDARAVWFRGEMTNNLLASKQLATWSHLRAGDNDCPTITFHDALARTRSARAVAGDMAAIVGDRFQVVDPPLEPSAIERHVERFRPGLVVVDYLQLCQADGFQDRRAQLDYIVRRLADLATRHNLALVVVSAIAKATSKDSGIGQLAKESNLLDYDVHTFTTLWADAPNSEQGDGRSRTTFKIEKSRVAMVGEEELWFDGDSQAFVRDLFEPFPEFASSRALP